MDIKKFDVSIAFRRSGHSGRTDRVRSQRRGGHVSIAFRRSGHSGRPRGPLAEYAPRTSPLPFGDQAIPAPSQSPRSWDQSPGVSIAFRRSGHSGHDHYCGDWCPLFDVSIAFRRSGHSGPRTGTERTPRLNNCLHCLSAIRPFRPGLFKTYTLDGMIQSPLPFGDQAIPASSPPIARLAGAAGPYRSGPLGR